MSQTYYCSNTASDLTGGGDHDFVLADATAAANTLSYDCPKVSTVSFDLFTPSGDPSDQGDATGSWSLEVNVITGDADVQLTPSLYRVNSGGTIQAGPIGATPQNTNAGILTFSWTNPALGTFASGDRVRVGLSFLNGTHGNATLELGLNTADEEFIAPYTLAGPKPYAFVVWA